MKPSAGPLCHLDGRGRLSVRVLTQLLALLAWAKKVYSEDIILNDDKLYHLSSLEVKVEAFRKIQSYETLLAKI